MPKIEFKLPGSKLDLTDKPMKESWLLLAGPWEGVTHLEIQAAGSWKQEGVGEFGPDGSPDVPFPSDKLTLADCPVGALIGKFGGSSASLAVAGAPTAMTDGLIEGKPFAIGSYCVVKVPAKSVGPLFVRFNGLQPPITITKLKIDVAGAALP